MDSGFLANMSLADFIKSEAINLGFYDCGISKARNLPYDERRMEMWLDEGNQADMSYLERNREKRYNPIFLVEESKSVISVLLNYFPEKILEEKDNFKISKYAYGKDYHHIIKDKLKFLLKKIEEKTGERIARVFTDSAPVLDRAWARESGLGFVGKNTTLINKKGGSFFFIGHIILDLEIDCVIQPVANSCGTCTKCIQACPTDALQPFKLDARKCISYLTIENRGEIPDEFNGKLNDFILGCDICMDVCPWNRFAKPNTEPNFQPSEELKAMRKQDWIDLDKQKFKLVFKGSAVERAGFNGLKRNINFVSNTKK
jgi:epoxyqueuosine reductase